MSTIYDEDEYEHSEYDTFEEVNNKVGKEISAMFNATFSTELGKRTIEHLKKVFVDRDMYETGMTLDEVAFRQGEASIVKKILKEINDG